MLLDVKQELGHTHNAVGVVVYTVCVNKCQLKTQQCINCRDTNRIAAVAAISVAAVAVAAVAVAAVAAAVYPYRVITVAGERFI